MSKEDIEKGANSLVDNIVDRTSKNGVTMLSIGPRADGTIPDYQIEMLKKLGTWMKVKKEALYGSTPAPFSKGGADTWKAGTIRFTEKGEYLYAIDLTKPFVGGVIPGIKLSRGSTISMLGCTEKLKWHQDGNNVVFDKIPDTLPCDYAWAFKIKLTDVIN
jgi:alpha-L-fucosidase